MIRAESIRASLVVLALAVASAGAAHAQTSSGDTTASGTSRAFNPAISLNSLFLGHFVSGLDEGAHEEEGEEHAEEGHAHLDEGLSVQEIELQFTADIDPYSKADATIAYHDGEFELEEAFVSTHRLPAGLGLRAGRMYVPFSLENATHTHQLPFTQRSLILGAISEEGLADVGAELRYLTPAPFYLELRGGVFDGGMAEEHEEGEEGAEEHAHEHAGPFAAPEGTDLAYHAGVASLWDLSESTTFALDGGYLFGKNGLSEDNSTYTHIYSGAATLRWKPTRRTVYRGFRARAEYTYVDAEEEDETHEISGWNTYAQFQFARRWWVQARYDLFDAGQGDDQWRAGGSIAFVPSEFQSIRLEVSQVDTHEDTYTEFFLQYNVTIGSHPAHRY